MKNKNPPAWATASTYLNIMEVGFFFAAFRNNTVLTSFKLSPCL
jgi:hypothetical protein